MYSANDLIDAVQRRLRLTLRRDHPPGEMPPGWRTWLAAAAARPGRVTGAPAHDFIAVLVARPLAMPPRRLDELSRWQAFSSIWRQQWQPAGRDQQSMRWLAGGGSAVIHVLLGVMMLWLLFTPPRPDAAAAAGELVVQVEFVGEGTPAEVGGPAGEDAPATPDARAAPATPTAASPQDTTAPSADDTPAPDLPRLAQPSAPPVPPVEVPLPEVARRDIPTPAPVPDQPLAVSEVVPDAPSVTFVLPPTRRTLQPATQAPSVTSQVPEVVVRDVPTPVQAPTVRPRELPVGPLASPAVSVATPDVGRRDIPMPVQPRAVPQVSVPTPATRELRSQAPAVPERAVPTLATRPSPATTAATTAPPSSTASALPPAGRPSAAPAGQGPRPDPAPGAWPSPRRADDWGDSQQARPGGQRGQPSGLYDSEGRVRLADAPGSASPNNPPGTVTEEIANLDRAGTWLRRPPTDYEPTMFDRYWRPSETLLEEWVRKGYKEVAIPIPGTNKRIICGIAFLALGGGCGISDPNLNNQPASARPPPDIPFKPELQEGNGALPPGG